HVAVHNTAQKDTPEEDETPPMSRQMRARTTLRDLVRPLRLRVVLDGEGFPMVPGRYGRIEWVDGQHWAVYTTHPRLFGRLWAISGLRRHQTGDDEMRALFPPEVMAHVARIIRAKRWGGSGRGRPENFAPRPDTRPRPAVQTS